MCYMMHEVQLAKSILWTLKKQISQFLVQINCKGKQRWINLDITSYSVFRHFLKTICVPESFLSTH